MTIVLLMGGAFYLVDRFNTRLYHEELTQRLNAPIAMYVTEQRQLITNGVPDKEGLRALAAHAMVINPTAEIYLLDETGAVLGHALSSGTALLDDVDLGPIRALISGRAKLPIHGQDPRGKGLEKVFSAAEIRTGDRLEGYLYVVLGGQTYEQLANTVSESYVGRVSIIAVIVIVLTAAVISLLVTRLLTRRLKHLSVEVVRIAEANFEQAPRLAPAHVGGDEIDRLTQSFLSMSGQIRGQFAQLRENDRLRRELVTNISHDLRTPLSAMQGYLETIQIRDDQLSAEDRQEYLATARRHACRLSTLIDDLFELSKFDSASVAPRLEAFSIAELVQDVAQEFQFQAESEGIMIGIDSTESAAFTVGDIGLIQRVLENLVRNALHFTPEGGSVVISVAEKPHSVTVAVADTGQGIPEKDMPRIFDRFYRSEKGEEASSGSSGLGLAIVKRILDLHASRITVTSQLDAGTRFEFDLPLHDRAA
jgi:signal transduction histidine kinase